MCPRAMSPIWLSNCWIPRILVGGVNFRRAIQHSRVPQPVIDMFSGDAKGGVKPASTRHDRDHPTTGPSSSSTWG